MKIFKHIAKLKECYSEYPYTHHLDSTIIIWKEYLLELELQIACYFLSFSVLSSGFWWMYIKKSAIGLFAISL